MNDTLFELPETTEETHAGTGRRCGDCVNAVRPHLYRDDWIYCRITPCRRTQFRIRKIKSRDAACNKFEERPDNGND